MASTARGRSRAPQAGAEPRLAPLAFLIDMADHAGFNDAYAEFFDFDGPTRSTVAVRQLPHPHQALMARAVAS